MLPGHFIRAHWEAELGLSWKAAPYLLLAQFGIQRSGAGPECWSNQPQLKKVYDLAKEGERKNRIRKIINA